MSKSLEELRNSKNLIDATQGKVELPVVESKPTLAETDPAFMSNPTSESGKRTPTIEGSPKNNAPLKVVNARFDPSNAVEFDINSLEKRKKEPSEMEKDLMSDLDRAVQREKDSITERIDALTAKQREEFEAQQGETGISSDINSFTAVNDEDDEDNYINEDLNNFASSDVGESPMVIKPIAAAPAVIDNESIDDDVDEDAVDIIDEDEEDAVTPIEIGSIDPEDLDEDLTAETGVELDNKAIADKFANEVKSHIKPISKVVDLASFKIGKTTAPIEAHLSFSDVSTADHFLPSAGKIITCSALSGTELMAMNPENSNRSRLNMLRDIYSIMYKHIRSTKPKSFDDWLKTTRYSDLDHIYFALYKATFAGSNFMHYECNKCHEVFINDVKFEDMIVYADDETKAAMEKIMNSGDTSATTYETTLVQISDEYAFSLRNPSIYNVVIEVAGLSDDFLTKYNELTDLIVYVDNIYYINRETQTLDPIDMKPDKDNLSKTIVHRIKAIAAVIRKLSSESYYELRRHILQSYPTLANVSYKIPACKCTKCGTEITETPVEAQTLLFMRHQLGAFAAL